MVLVAVVVVVVGSGRVVSTNNLNTFYSIVPLTHLSVCFPICILNCCYAHLIFIFLFVFHSLCCHMLLQHIPLTSDFPIPSQPLNAILKHTYLNRSFLFIPAILFTYWLPTTQIQPCTDVVCSRNFHIIIIFISACTLCEVPLSTTREAPEKVSMIWCDMLFVVYFLHAVRLLMWMLMCRCPAPSWLQLVWSGKTVSVGRCHFHHWWV